MCISRRSCPSLKHGRGDSEARIILRTRARTVFSVSFHVSILSSNGPLKAEKDMACVVVICSSSRAIYLRGTDAVATRPREARRLSYDHEDCVEVAWDRADAIDAKFNFARC